MYSRNGQAGVVIVIVTWTLPHSIAMPYTRPRSTMLIPSSGSITSRSARRTSASVMRPQSVHKRGHPRNSILFSRRGDADRARTARSATVAVYVVQPSCRAYPRVKFVVAKSLVERLVQREHIHLQAAGRV